MISRSLALLAAALLTAGCIGRNAPPALGPLPFPADTIRAERIADGVVHRFIYSREGPWAINVLDVDLSRCNAIVAVKGADSAAGRIKTTAMLATLSGSRRVLGGVNADFFSLTTGVPTNLLVVDDRMLTPPSVQPVLAFDSAGAPSIERFSLSGADLRPFHPHEAVGGRPAIVRDSVILAAVDTFGQASFIARNPRTAAGIANRGHRVMLVAVDGRQAGYSAGMSLRELATLMRALGARDAINLDGGGSTTLVVADPRAGALRIANHPSDAGGERAVGDALAVVRGASCGR